MTQPQAKDLRDQLTLDGDPAFSVIISAGDLMHELWRDQFGQVDIDSWCDAHGAYSNEVRWVAVHGWPDGRRVVELHCMARDAAGRLVLDHTGDEIKRHVVLTEQVRSLPEGMGALIRWTDTPAASRVRQVGQQQ